MYDKSDLQRDFRKRIALVKFEKADGTIREMRCTLKEEFLPPKKDEYSPRKENDTVLAVWDLEKNAWRSFNLDAILSLEYEA